MFQNTLTDDQQMMIESTHRLVREVIIEPRIDQKYDQSCEFPHDIYQLLWENGMVQLEFPQSVGGPGQ